VRLDARSPRPHNMAYYSVQGDRGAYESWRGLGDVPKVWLADAHEPSKSRRSGPDDRIAEWHPLRDFAAQYIPERLAAPEEAKRSGHFGADYWMLRDFARALLDDAPSPIDAYRALDFCVPGILAIASRANGGAPAPVPDFRPKAAATGRVPAAAPAVAGSRADCVAMAAPHGRRARGEPTGAAPARRRAEGRRGGVRGAVVWYRSEAGSR
jgi:hypothetical protein